MNAFQQIISALYVALAEAAGGPTALRVANQVLRDAIADGAVDDPTAVGVLKSLSHDEDNEQQAIEPLSTFSLLITLAAEPETAH